MIDWIESKADWLFLPQTFLFIQNIFLGKSYSFKEGPENEIEFFKRVWERKHSYKIMSLYKSYKNQSHSFLPTPSIMNSIKFCGFKEHL